MTGYIFAKNVRHFFGLALVASLLLHPGCGSDTSENVTDAQTDTQGQPDISLNFAEDDAGQDAGVVVDGSATSDDAAETDDAAGTSDAASQDACTGLACDDDDDGVTNGDDQCPGGDDNVDENSNDVPDDCDCTVKVAQCDTTLAECVIEESLAVCKCKPGYSGDGTECSNIDECKDGVDGHDACAANADCTDNEGSYSCACPSGEFDEGDPTYGAGCTPINLITNGDFASNTSGWTIINIGDGSTQYSADDAADSDSSGSAAITCPKNSSTAPLVDRGATLWQCAPVTAGKTYTLQAKYTGSPDHTELVIRFYDSDTCFDSMGHLLDSPLVEYNDLRTSTFFVGWATFGGGSTSLAEIDAPANAKNAAILLRSYQQQPHFMSTTGYWDNVIFQRR